MKNNIIAVIGLGIILVIVMVLFSKGIEKNDMVNCYKYQRQSLELEGFYVTELENEICNQVGVPLTSVIIK